MEMQRGLLVILFWVLPVFAHAEVQVEIKGLPDRLLTNVQAQLSIHRQRQHSELSTERLTWLHQRAAEEIKRALQPFGYYHAEVSGKLQQTREGWRAHYQVTPGRPLKVRSVDIQIKGPAHDDPVFQKILSDSPLRVGVDLEHPQYEQLKRKLRQAAAANGYFDARFERHELRLQLEDYAADVVLYFSSGPRYRFGAVHFDDDTLEKEFLARYVPFKPGEPYRTSELLVLQNALSDSDYYEHVEVTPRRKQAGEDLQVPIDVRLQPQKRNKYTLGLGYGTDTGARISAGLERRYVNRRGHRFGILARGSEIRNSVSTRYTIPVGDPRTDRIMAKVEWIDNEPKTSRSETLLAGLAWEKTRGRWLQALSVTVEQERFRVGATSGRTLLVMPGASWTYIKGDSPVYVRRGLRFGVDVRGAAEELGSDTSFVQAKLHGKWIQPINGGRFITRAEAGSSWTNEFQELPPSVRFFAGGDQSVRGFAFNTLGPRDAAGAVIGGKHLLTASVEYEHRLFEDWSAALFVDTGNAFDDFGDRLERAAGLGVRWKSPIGWLRLDVARPVSRDDADWRVHFTLGPDL